MTAGWGRAGQGLAKRSSKVRDTGTPGNTGPSSCSDRVGTAKSLKPCAASKRMQTGWGLSCYTLLSKVPSHQHPPTLRTRKKRRGGHPRGDCVLPNPLALRPFPYRLGLSASSPIPRLRSFPFLSERELDGKTDPGVGHGSRDSLRV